MIENNLTQKVFNKNMISIEELASFCKKKGIVFPSSEIYGGFSGFWDYGPVGVEIKRNLENAWWNFFVKNRDDIVGVDGSIITHPKVWEASGHVGGFNDPLVDCPKCNKRYRVDHLLEKFVSVPEGLSEKQFDELIKKYKIKCPSCKVKLGGTRKFNLMFKTQVGPVGDNDNISYLRPETAQTIFTNVKNVLDTTRIKPPFGVAQIGKAFRNEISPRNFLFRSREFNQMEIEFLNTSKKIPKEYAVEIKSFESKVLKVLVKGKTVNKSLKQLVDEKLIGSKWILYWIVQQIKFLKLVGVDLENVRLRRHDVDELSHYSSETWDFEYLFDGSYKEIMGLADRSDFDLGQHQKFSGKDLTYFDEETKKKSLLKTVCEPSMGSERLFLSVLMDAYVVDNVNNRVVLRLDPKISAYKVAVFPLVKKDGLKEIAKTIHDELKNEFSSFYDEKSSVGKRYRRQDELGTPFCVTVDYDTKLDESVTIRDRDTLVQDRIKISELRNYLRDKIFS